MHSVGGHLNINVYPDIVDISASVPATCGAPRRCGDERGLFRAGDRRRRAQDRAHRRCRALGARTLLARRSLARCALCATLCVRDRRTIAPIPADLARPSRALRSSKCATFAKRAFRSANATFALAGNVDASLLDAVTAGSGGQRRTRRSVFDFGRRRRPTRRSTRQLRGEGLAWTGPPIADERAATALDFVADYLFRDETGVVSKALDPTGDAYVNGQFITLARSRRHAGHDRRQQAGAVWKRKCFRAIAKLADAAGRRIVRRGARSISLSISPPIRKRRTNRPTISAGTRPKATPRTRPATSTSSYWKAARSLDPRLSSRRSSKSISLIRLSCV